MHKKRSNNLNGSDNSRKEEGEIEPKTKRPASERKFAYEIRLRNHLDQRWVEWFDGWTITNIDDDEVILFCSSTDHPGLHGALDKIRDLNLTLVSVKQVSRNSSGSESEP